MWQGLQAIMDYKPKPGSFTNTTASLPDDLNRFYARFEHDSGPPDNAQILVEHSVNEATHQMTEADMSKFFKSIKA